MEPASLFRDKPPSEQRNLTVFRAEMVAREETSWRELFRGFDNLKAITYSSGLDLILELTGMFCDVEVTFGSERILSREPAALEQASHIAKGVHFRRCGGRSEGVSSTAGWRIGQASACATAEGSERHAALSAPAQDAEPREALPARGRGQTSGYSRLR